MDIELKLMEGLDVEVLWFSALRGHFQVRGIASGGGLHLARAIPTQRLGVLLKRVRKGEG